MPISCAWGFALVLGVASCHYVHGVTCLCQTFILWAPRASPDLGQGKLVQQVRVGRRSGAVEAGRVLVDNLVTVGSVVRASVFLSHTHICFLQPIDFGMNQTWLEFPPCHLVATSVWSSYLTLLSLNFSIYKIGMTVTIHLSSA